MKIKRQDEPVNIGQIKARALAIQVTTRRRCNMRCRYCISCVTVGTKEEASNTIRQCRFDRLKLGLRLSQLWEAERASLTGRAEPTQEDPEYLLKLTATCHEYLPVVEMNTNGLLLQKDQAKHGLLKELVSAGLTMVTFSIASFDQKINDKLMSEGQRPAELLNMAAELELTTRCSLVVNKQGVKDFAGIMDYIKIAGNLGAQFVVIREIWCPDFYLDFNAVYRWNVKNKVLIKPLQDEFFRIAANEDNPYGLRFRRRLPWGQPIFVVDKIFNDPTHGVNVVFAYCEEFIVGNVLKTVVHRPNGHGYANWDDNADILY